MAKASGFHVRHDLQPVFTYELLMLLHASSEGQTKEMLQASALSQGYALRQRKDYGKLLNSLEDLGVIVKQHKTVSLSPIGQIIAEISSYQRHLLAELIHFLYYTLFETDKNARSSWSYRTVCNHLWMTAPATLNRDRLVNIVVQNAKSEFGENSISFSTQSVMGILYWIESLHPACMDISGRVFTRRLYCPIEMFTLALQHVYQCYRAGGMSVLLTPEIRQQVCRICLIVPEAFQEMLEQAESSFDHVQMRRERGERLIVTNLEWDFLKE
jgi:hypothetical protein